MRARLLISLNIWLYRGCRTKGFCPLELLSAGFKTLVAWLRTFGSVIVIRRC